MDRVVDLRTLPPPRDRVLADGLALVAGIASVVALFFLAAALAVLASGGPRHHRGVVENQPAETAALMAPVVIAFAVTAWGLRRRRRWARWAVVTELAAGIGLDGLSLGILANSHERTDSAAMAGVSVAFCGLGLVVLLVVVLLPGNREAFRPPRAGWYPDPAGRRVRWWDGASWTDHNAD